MEERNVIRTQKYTVIIEHFNDGTSTMHRINDGFCGFELVGICDLITTEVRDQMRGNIKPDIIKREVIE